MVLWRIKEWLMIREDYGMPDADVIFSDVDGSYLTTEQLRRQFYGACEAAGIEKVTPYQIRHSINDFLRRQEVPEELRALYLGQDPDSGINRNYTDPRLEELRHHIERIGDLFGHEGPKREWDTDSETYEKT